MSDSVSGLIITKLVMTHFGVVRSECGHIDLETTMFRTIFSASLLVMGLAFAAQAARPADTNPQTIPADHASVLLSAAERDPAFYRRDDVSHFADAVGGVYHLGHPILTD